MEELFRPLAEDKGLSLELQLPQTPLTVSADPRQLQRSFSNLLDNALKYTEAGGKVRITARVAGSAVEIAVADNGLGISEAEQTRIFERFYRVESSRSTPGNGLGLNMAEAFIRNHGGRLELRSREGQGSTFTASLPLLNVS